MNDVLHHSHCHSFNDILFIYLFLLYVLSVRHPSHFSSMMPKAVPSCLRGETTWLSIPSVLFPPPHLFQWWTWILCTHSLYLMFLKLCSAINASWFESAMFSMTRLHSSQHSMGPVVLLGLCEVYKVTNKWSKLNMDIIRHYQSAAAGRGGGFQVAWGFYWSVTRGQLLPPLLEQVLFYSIRLASLPTSHSLSKWLFNESDEA